MFHVKQFLLVFLAVCTAVFAQEKASQFDSFISFDKFPDTAGKHINAHGAGIVSYDGAYYLYGEFRERSPKAAVSCYKSTDLYNWENLGVVLTSVDTPGHDIETGCLIERPKVIYNAKTGKFVMWFHLEMRGRGYDAARTAVAVSDKPEGPFAYVRSIRPNRNVWPLNFSQGYYQAYRQAIESNKIKGFQASEGYSGVFLNRDMETGQMSRDMTLFVDDDGKAYHIHSSEENQTLHISELTDDYQDFTGRYVRVLPGESNEAPAICKFQGKYYMITSGCTGWAPNAARSAVAPTIWGPWTVTGNPCMGVNPHNNLGQEMTWGGQSTFLLPVPGKEGCFLAMFDLWRPNNQQDSRYLWLPAYIKNNQILVTWQNKWSLSWFDSPK